MEGFLKSLIISGLVSKGYSPLLSKCKKINTIDDIKYLRKDNHIITFIDADNLSVRKLKKIYFNNYKFLNGIRSKSFLIFEQVILHRDNLTKEKIKLLKSMFNEINFVKKFLITSSINENDKVVKKYYKDSDVNSFYYNNINDILDKDFDEIPKLDVSQYWKKTTLSIKDIKPYGTYLILAIDLIIGIFMLVDVSLLHKRFSIDFYDVLTDYAAKENSWMTSQGEYWRWITPIFLHSGVIHLLIDLALLFFLGGFVEKILGRKKFIVMFLTTGLLGVATNFVSLPRETGVAGSVPIFGILGCSFYLVKKHNLSMKQMYRYVVGIFLLLDIVVTITCSSVDVMSQVMGFCAGLLFAKSLKGRSLKDNKEVANTSIKSHHFKIH